MNTIHSVTCPQKTKTENRRSEQAKWRASKEWKQLVDEHAHAPGAICVHCLKYHGQPAKKEGGRPIYLTINHLSRALYTSKELYCTWNESLMEICCTTCNWMYEKGKEPCPLCHNQYISVIEPDHMCQSCYDKLHPEEAERKRADRERKRAESKALLKRLRDDEKARMRSFKTSKSPSPKPTLRE